MKNIVDPTDATFDFSQLALKTPSGIQGGSYFTKIEHDGRPLYVQTTKSKSKQGIVKTGKKYHCDLMFGNDAESLLTWFERLEETCQEMLFEKRDEWFQNKLEKADIETAFNSVIRVFKSGKYYLVRANIKSAQNAFEELTPSIQLYDEMEMPVDLSVMTNETNVISILEIQGIKFTTKNFQIEIELKQMMVVNDEAAASSLFSDCLIKSSKSKEAAALNAIVIPSDDSPSDAIVIPSNVIDLNAIVVPSVALDDSFPSDAVPLDEAKPVEKQEQEQEQEQENEASFIGRPGVLANEASFIGRPGVLANEDSIIDRPGVLAKEDSIIDRPGVLAKEDSIIDRPGVLAKEDSIGRPGVLAEEESPSSLTTPTPTAISLLLEETDGVPFCLNIEECVDDDVSIGSLCEVDVKIETAMEPMTLKKPNEVYFELYKEARMRAKLAKKKTILAYLEAKNIKKTYMLENMDDSDGEFDDEIEEVSESELENL